MTELTTPGPQLSGADDDAAIGESDGPRRKILIGSQRNPAAYQPKRRDWAPIDAPPANPPAAENPADDQSPPSGGAALAVDVAPVGERAAPTAADTRSAPREMPASPPAPRAKAAVPRAPEGRDEDASPADAAPQVPQPSLREQLREQKKGPPVGKIPPPNLRDRLSPDLEAELEAALGSSSIDDLLKTEKQSAAGAGLQLESRHRARVIAVRRDDVFVELGDREQGSVSLRQFAAPPQAGDMIEVIVQKLNAEDGLYELTLPGAAQQVEDWGDLTAGMVVEARVTGHNAGGLECEVNHIRGFIPMSQIGLYRVENAAEYVGQSLTCVVNEANPERRNLVLSRRAMLEREREEKRTSLLEALAPGQVREGVVRKLMDFGAFVDLGGADGLLHVSQLAWHRVQHPSEVLQEGQTIKVKVEKIDPETRKISLSYREMVQNPWNDAAQKYPVSSVVRGRVSKIMEFGAFVQLEPGIEGLVHISELAHKRVWRVSDIVKEGDEIEAMVLSIDREAQRMSLSMKALAAKPEKPKKEDAVEPPPAETAAAAPAKHREPSKPLRGGLGRGSGGEQFGLKW